MPLIASNIVCFLPVLPCEQEFLQDCPVELHRVRTKLVALDFNSLLLFCFHLPVGVTKTVPKAQFFPEQ